MKINEAIQNSNGNWFRPISWRGAGMAYCLKDMDTHMDTHLVPSSKGGECGMTHDFDALIGDWEIVTPDIVLDERC